MVDAVQRKLLIDSIMLLKWSLMDYTYLDAAYQAATPAEKQKLMDSLKGNDDGARNLIKQKFQETLIASTSAEVDKYITDYPDLMSLFAQILQLKGIA